MWLSIIMEGHESHSESGEGNRSRYVTALSSDDVNERNDRVFMPDTIEMAKIENEEKGQYVNGIPFPDNMSEEEVQRRLPLLNMGTCRCICKSILLSFSFPLVLGLSLNFRYDNTYTRIANQPVRKSVSQSVSQPINKPVSQLVGKSFSQSVSTSVNQSVSQSVIHSVIHSFVTTNNWSFSW